MNGPWRFSSLLRRVLLALLFFGAVSAFGGGAMGVFANGAGVPLSYLVDSPFSSFLIPGLILAFVVGGTQLLAAISTSRRTRHSNAAAATAGFGMIIWIFAEIAMMSEYSWLQTVYFTLGAAELALVFGLLGILGPRTAHQGDVAPQVVRK